MNKALLTGMSALLISLNLVGCSSNSNNKGKDSSSKDAKSEKIASSKKDTSESKSKESSKKKAESESKAKAESESKAKENDANQPQKNDSSSQSSNTPDFSLDIHSFVNKYGMSEVAYKSQYMGMTTKEALYATPDSHETSGELQSENIYRNGQDPYANDNSNQDPSDYNSDYYNDDDDYEEYSDGSQKYVPGKNDDWYTEQYWKHHPEEVQKAKEDEQNADDNEDDADDDYYDDEDY